MTADSDDLALETSGGHPAHTVGEVGIEITPILDA